MKKRTRIALSMGAALMAVSIVSLAEGPATPDDLRSPPERAERSETGLVSVVLQAGDGVHRPRAEDRVRVHVTGWTADGTRIEDTTERNEPRLLRVDAVLDGWSEGIRLMVEGERRRLWVPERLAYRGATGMPGGTLVFDIELLEIEHAVPVDLESPPPEAEKSPSGLVSLVLRKGRGTTTPTSGSTVVVHYTGWTTKGREFDTTRGGRPARFSLGALIPGWAEGLLMMKRGEKRRLWIPEHLAYAGRPGKPAGTLVFEVELMDFR